MFFRRFCGCRCRKKVAKIGNRFIVGHQARIMSEETKRKIRTGNIKRWSDPEYTRKMMKLFGARPNRLEISFGNFLERIFPDEYKYVGDGEFILAGKCPDFVNVNGKKKIIELYGEYWHKDHNPQDRIDLFKQYGYDTLIVWSKELRDLKRVENKIRNFNRSKNVYTGIDPSIHTGVRGRNFKNSC